jgi:kynurenine formamidase
MNKFLFVISFTLFLPVLFADNKENHIGMAKFLGNETWNRCASLMLDKDADVYELSYERSGSMPLSPFAGKFIPKFLPTGPTKNEVQLANMDVLNEDVNTANQGTQMDAFGHFAYTEKVWDGEAKIKNNEIKYFDGLTQDDVKQTQNSPLLKLGIENVPPIITSALLLDVRKFANQGKKYSAGEFITRDDLEITLQKSGLSKRGIIPGDVIMIYTGWSDYYKDPDTTKIYYSTAPGISYDAAKYLASKEVVAVGLDTCCVDARPDPNNPDSFKQPEGTPKNQSFPVHDYFLTKVGVHTLENLNLKKIANNGVYESCTMILPLKSKGSAGSPIIPVAIGKAS